MVACWLPYEVNENITAVDGFCCEWVAPLNDVRSGCLNWRHGELNQIRFRRDSATRTSLMP